MHAVHDSNLSGKENSIAYEVKISLGDTLQTIPVTISTAFSGLWVPKRVRFIEIKEMIYTFFRAVPTKAKTVVSAQIKELTILPFQRLPKR